MTKIYVCIIDRLSFYQTDISDKGCLVFCVGCTPECSSSAGRYEVLCNIYVLHWKWGQERETREEERLETQKVQFSSGDVIYKLWVIFDEVKLAPGLLCILHSKCFRVSDKKLQACWRSILVCVIRFRPRIFKTYVIFMFV